LSDEEKQELTNVMSKLGKLTANQLGELSHQDVPWIVTEENDIIDYDLVFYRKPEMIQKVE
jgi:uncharacterized phage-associated protein